jgi:hypothetical protein
MSTVLIGGNRTNVVGGFAGTSFAQPQTTYVTESFQPAGYSTTTTEYIQPTTTYVQQPTTTYVQQPATTYTTSSVPVTYTTGATVTYTTGLATTGIATSQAGIVTTGEVIKGTDTFYLGESRI